MLGRKRYGVHIFKRRKLAHNCTTLNKRDFFSRVKQHLFSRAEDLFFSLHHFGKCVRSSNVGIVFRGTSMFLVRCAKKSYLKNVLPYTTPNLAIFKNVLFSMVQWPKSNLSFFKTQILKNLLGLSLTKNEIFAQENSSTL